MKPIGQGNTDGNKQGEWLTQFSQACLRITSMLDVDSILQEVIDSACALTGARYGALLTFDESGGLGDLITSGIAPEERRRMGDPPKGLGVLGYLNEIEGSLRLPDISGHASSVGFPKNHPPMKTFLGSPLRFQGERLGNIYLTEKEGGREFSQEDEEILVMFASQSAVVIANSRVLSTTRQARADMEALVNVSPVGVLVFDAKTGVLVSANDEARRVIGKLNQTGNSIGEILEVITLRRVDGSSIPMDELPTTKALTRGETVLADEIVIHLPDGRKITTLVNARPVYGEDGNPVSVVATIQDISPLEEMKRQRAEFLGNVSHELRTPLTAIKGSTSTLLSSSYPPGPTETRQFLRVIDEQADRMHNLINDLVDATQIEAGTLSVTAEPTETADLLEEAREAHLRAAESNGSVELELPSALPRVMADRRRILQAYATSSPRQPPRRGIRTLRQVVDRQDQRVAERLLCCGHGGHPGRRCSLGHPATAIGEVFQSRRRRGRQGNRNRPPGHRDLRGNSRGARRASISRRRRRGPRYRVHLHDPRGRRCCASCRAGIGSIGGRPRLTRRTGSDSGDH